MLAAKAESVPVTESQHRSSFFRQSGWLMIANIGGGMMMWAVHLLTRAIGAEEYGIFGVLLAVVMLVPNMPLNMVLAHQTAQGLARRRERELSGMIRLALMGTFALWLIGAVIVALFHQQILTKWNIVNPLGLWLTILAVLGALWQPIFWGVLQGAQNFLWWGWSMIINGIGRLVIAAGLIWILVKMTSDKNYAMGTLASGIMVGVLAGYVVSTALAAWHTRKLWTTPAQPFDRGALLREAVPPLFAFAAFQFLLTADTMFVKSYFSSTQAGYYVSAGTLSRALMWLVGPLAAVMFPRLVHSAAKSEKSNLMGLVLIGTAALALTGAVSLWLLGPLIVKIVYGPSFAATTSSLLPWYAFAMVPLCVANVLLNNLLAKSSAKAAVPLLLLAVAYGFALNHFNASLQMVLKTMGLCNIVLLGVCAFFTWVVRPAKSAPAS